MPEHILGAGAGNGTRQLLDLLLSLSPSWPKHLAGAIQSGIMPPENNNKIRSTYEIKIHFSTLTPHTSPPASGSAKALRVLDATGREQLQQHSCSRRLGAAGSIKSSLPSHAEQHSSSWSRFPQEGRDAHG